MIRSLHEFETRDLHRLHPEMEPHIPSHYRGKRLFLRRLDANYVSLEQATVEGITATWQVRVKDGSYRDLKPRIQQLLEVSYIRSLHHKLHAAYQANVNRQLKEHLALTNDN